MAQQGIKAQSNAEISNALQELTNMDPKELEEFHKQYQKKFKKVFSTNPGPATPLLPITAPANLITTPANKTALECLQNVEKVVQSKHRYNQRRPSQINTNLQQDVCVWGGGVHPVKERTHPSSIRRRRESRRAV